MYPNIINDVLNASRLYKAHQLSLEEYELIISNAADNIVSIEEKRLSDFLRSAAGKLDIIKFTTDNIKLFDLTCKVANEVETFLNKWERLYCPKNWDK